MLVLTRKINESINIGQDIEIMIIDITDDHVKIGIKAPKNIPIYRQEIFKAILEENERAALSSKTALHSLNETISQRIGKKTL